jgi:hypothetical protein
MADEDKDKAEKVAAAKKRVCHIRATPYKPTDANTTLSTSNSRSRKQRRTKKAPARRRQTKPPMMPHQ